MSLTTLIVPLIAYSEKQRAQAEGRQPVPYPGTVQALKCDRCGTTRPINPLQIAAELADPPVIENWTRFIRIPGHFAAFQIQESCDYCPTCSIEAAQLLARYNRKDELEPATGHTDKQGRL